MRGEATTLRDPQDPRHFAAIITDRGEATAVTVVIIDPTGRRATSAAAPAVVT